MIPLDRMPSFMNPLSARDIADAIQLAGIGKNINFAPHLEGMIAGEAESAVRVMFQMFVKVLQDDGSLRTQMVGALGL